MWYSVNWWNWQGEEKGEKNYRGRAIYVIKK